MLAHTPDYDTTHTLSVSFKHTITHTLAHAVCLGLSQSSVPGVSTVWNTSARLNKVNIPLSPPHTHTDCDNSLDQWAATQRHKHTHFFLSHTDGIQKICIFIPTQTLDASQQQMVDMLPPKNLFNR